MWKLIFKGKLDPGDLSLYLRGTTIVSVLKMLPVAAAGSYGIKNT